MRELVDGVVHVIHLLVSAGAFLIAWALSTRLSEVERRLGIVPPEDDNDCRVFSGRYATSDECCTECHQDLEFYQPIRYRTTRYRLCCTRRDWAVKRGADEESL